MTSLHIKQNNWIKLVEYLYIHFNISLLWWWSEGQGVLEKGINWFDCYAICFDSTLNMISMKMNVDISLKTHPTSLRWTFHNLIVIIVCAYADGHSFDTLLRHSGFTTFFSFRQIISRYAYFSFRLGIHFSRFGFYIENSTSRQLDSYAVKKIENKNLSPSSRWTAWSFRPESNLPHETNIHYWPLSSRFACIYAKVRFHSLTYIQHRNKHTFRALSFMVKWKKLFLKGKLTSNQKCVLYMLET